jgi:hypothetical protein
MGFVGLARSLGDRRALPALAIALTLAACAHGVDPDRSGLTASSGGSAGAGGSAGSAGSPAGGSTTSANGGSTTTSTTSSTDTTSSTTTTTDTSTTTTTTSSTTTTTTSSTTTTTTTNTMPVMGLHVQYKVGNASASTVDIKGIFNIVNDGMSSVPVNSLSIRYWFTSDGGAQTEAFFCDYAMMGAANVMGSFGAKAGMNADHYLEVTFSAAAGTLAPGAQTGEIQARFNKTDFSNFDQTNDYSFDATKASFADWQNVTLYQNGTLVWGVEP